MLQKAIERRTMSLPPKNRLALQQETCQEPRMLRQLAQEEPFTPEGQDAARAILCVFLTFSTRWGGATLRARGVNAARPSPTSKRRARLNARFVVVLPASMEVGGKGRGVACSMCLWRVAVDVWFRMSGWIIAEGGTGDRRRSLTVKHLGLSPL